MKQKLVPHGSGFGSGPIGPVRRGKRDGINPEGAAHRDVRRFRRRRKRLTVVPACLRTQRLHRWARCRAAFFWLLFFAVQRKVTRATRATLCSLLTKCAKSAPIRLRHLPP